MNNSTHRLVLVIGSLAILAGVIMVVLGKSFEEYWLAFFSGVTLIGTVMIQKKQTKEENKP